MCDCQDHHDRAGLDRRSMLRLGAGAAGVVTVAALSTTVEAATAARPKVIRKVFRGEFTDPATPDWHHLPFRVPRGVSRIDVRYDYRPTDTGVGISYNVVDIGLFDDGGHELGSADGFRGWSGGARRSFRLKTGRATPGYIAGPIDPGEWYILLGPYLIVGAGTPYKVVVEMTLGRPGKVFTPEPAPAAVPGTAAGWYRGDLHLHTVHSDGKRNQPQLLTAAREAGLDLLGSSEHNTSSASYVWGRHVPDDFLVVNGEEVTTRSGHWLAMGIPPMTWIDWRYRAEEDRFGDFARHVRDLGGVVIACHPNNPVPSIRWDHGYDGVDAIELWNGPWTADDQKTVTQWHSWLVDGRFVPGLGNSDSHNESQPVGLPMTSYRLESLATTEVVAAVRGGHCWIAESAAVDLTFTATLGESVAECGDRLAAGVSDVVSVHLEASGVPDCVAILWGASGKLGGAVALDDGSLVLDQQVPSAERFVRIEIGRPDGEVGSPVEDTPLGQMVALTNPVFLTSSQ